MLATVLLRPAEFGVGQLKINNRQMSGRNVHIIRCRRRIMCSVISLGNKPKIEHIPPATTAEGVLNISRIGLLQATSIFYIMMLLLLLLLSPCCATVAPLCNVSGSWCWLPSPDWPPFLFVQPAEHPPSSAAFTFSARNHPGAPWTEAHGVVHADDTVYIDYGCGTGPPCQGGRF